jgi:hypothetical protein
MRVMSIYSRMQDLSDAHDCDPVPFNYRLCRCCRQWKDIYAQSELCDECLKEIEEENE